MMSFIKLQDRGPCRSPAAGDLEVPIRNPGKYATEARTPSKRYVLVSFLVDVHRAPSELHVWLHWNVLMTSVHVCILQVLDLRPGRKYEFRIVLYPIVQPPFAQPPSQPPSPIVAFLTAATVPGVPPPPSSSRIERTALVVHCWSFACSRQRDLLVLMMRYPSTSGSEHVMSAGEN